MVPRQPLQLRVPRRTAGEGAGLRHLTLQHHLQAVPLGILDLQVLLNLLDRLVRLGLLGLLALRSLLAHWAILDHRGLLLGLLVLHSLRLLALLGFLRLQVLRSNRFPALRGFPGAAVLSRSCLLLERLQEMVEHVEDNYQQE